MSFISPYALLFFGKSQLSNDKSSSEENLLLQVDHWINIHIDCRTHELINELKEKFNYLLEKKALKKNLCLENEGNLLETIIHFITKQDRNFLLQNQLMNEDSSKKRSIVEDWDDDTKDLPERHFSLTFPKH